MGDTKSEEVTKLRGYLVETYRLLSQAEKTLPFTADLEERAALRSKINEYESYLSKWQRELEELQGADKVVALNTEGGETDGNEDFISEKEYGPAYFFGLARKAFAQGLFAESLALAEIVREQDPLYPGLDSFEQHLRETTGENIPLNPEPPVETPKPLFDKPRFWLLACAAIVLVVVVAIVTIILTTPPPKNSPVTRTLPIVTEAVQTLPIVFPRATEAPLLIATPTVPVQPSVPPDFEVITARPGATLTITPPPTPTKKP